MRRRTFVTGALAAGTALAWRRATGPGPAAGEGERLADGRALVRGAAFAFGTTVSVAAVHDDPARARAGIAAALAEVRAVDALMTVYRRESPVGRLNADGVLLAPDPRLLRVLAFSQRLAALSGGAFDPTVQPLWSLYAACRRAGRLPGAEELAAARALVGWRGLEVGPRRVALARPGMAITLNGVAQGFALDLALAALAERGVGDALVDAGEHGAGGAPEPGRAWTVGLAHPRRPGALLGAVALDGRALAISGDYATAFSDDLAHHHVLDPATGRSPPGLSSAAVAAPTGMEADALTKPMMVLPRREAEALLGRFPGAGAIWVDKDGVVAGARGLALLPPPGGPA